MSRKKVLLIHPPVVRPSEPSPGLARLAGALSHAGIDCIVLDANLEGLRYLCSIPPEASDTWTQRAFSGVNRNLAHLSRPELFKNTDQYRQAVFGLNRVLEMNGQKAGVLLSLTDCQDRHGSPTSSQKLIEAFDKPEKNLFHPYFSQRLRRILLEDMPDLVGISINFLGQALCGFAMAGFIKKLAPDLPVAIGGGLVTSWMKQPGWDNPFKNIINHLIAGPGEEPLLSMMGRPPSDELPPPDYDHVFTLPYLSPGFVLPYSASTGCYWRQCAFCPEKAEHNPYRPIPPRTVVSQLRTLVEKYRPAMIHLTDNALSPALLKTLSRNPPGAPWYGFTRITHHLADIDFCKALQESGCVMLQLGVESGSQRVLDAFGKGINLRTVQKALAALKQAHIAAYVYLLFGTPWEEEKDAEKTFDFAVRQSETIAFLNLAVFNLPAYSPESDSLKTRPFYKGDLTLYRDFSHPNGWQRLNVRQFIDKKFKRHPAIAAIIQNDPPAFTSNHAPFFVMADRYN